MIKAESTRMDVDVAIIGAGISGLATLKTLIELGLKVVLVEATNAIGGLWRYTRDGYGVMSFTHINVSKYNYCFSDFPFPLGKSDFPHHSEMHNYICSYVERFDLARHIKFLTQVEASVFNEDKSWTLHCREETTESHTFVVKCKTLAVATGHHAKPRYPHFEGQESFKGEIIHSVAYKDVKINGLIGKKVVIVGIGNSAIDIAVNIAENAGVGDVHLSTRSGAWIMPNYMLGYPVDLYASRLMFETPWQLNQLVLQTIIRLMWGSPHKWNLNPKMGLLQAHITVSPTLVHHIQRGKVKVVSNIKAIQGSRIIFADGGIADDVSALIMCTGYDIDLPFLPPAIVDKVLDKKEHSLNLFGSMFNPDIGKSLAFIGFMQPASGGLLSISEVQAQWLGQVVTGACFLPSPERMKADMAKELANRAARYYESPRHTVQQDPIAYNDKITALFGGKPQLWKHPRLAWQLFFGSGGPAQWRLQGPYKWKGAADVVRRVPTPPLSACLFFFAIALIGLLMRVLSPIFIRKLCNYLARS